jgi:hypothetical protein
VAEEDEAEDDADEVEDEVGLGALSVAVAMAALDGTGRVVA